MPATEGSGAGHRRQRCRPQKAAVPAAEGSGAGHRRQRCRPQKAAVPATEGSGAGHIPIGIPTIPGRDREFPAAAANRIREQRPIKIPMLFL